MGNGPLPAPAQGAGGQLQNVPQGIPGESPEGGPAAPGMQPDPTMAPMPGTPGQQEPDQSAKIEDWVDYAYTQVNLAKKLSKSDSGKEKLKKMAREIIEGYDEDEESRRSWMERNQEWLKLALLVRENKSFPWPKASNVKYPLLATAAMQFSARAYPALVPSDRHIVKTRVVQTANNAELYNAAERITQHMSYQLLERIPDWEENMDKLLMTMAISGICFKETYYSAVDKLMHSQLVYPEEFVVNYHAKSLKKAYRKTRILKYTDNEVLEKVNNDQEFLDVDLSKPSEGEDKNKKEFPATGIQPPPVDKSTPHKFIACHTFWDLDDDGYEEPYVIVVHVQTRQVVRVMARWAQAGVKKADDGKIIKIEPMEYFTAFPFIPNPDGSIYALGFGLLLGPLNESVNSLINQLVDSGTLNNMQSGFIGKGLRLRMGQTSLQPGEFKVVNATGEDLQKSIYTMPTKEPSNVLFQLLNMLITSGNQLASIAEIFVGKMPGQNTPATTTQETIQQGMAVFTAIYKRVYRSLSEEFQKLFRLNKICPGIVEEEGQIAGIQLQESDYELPSWAVIPGADPTGDSSTVRQGKLQAVGQLLQLGTVDPMVYTKMTLDALEVPNGQQLIKQPQPAPPDPKAELLKQKAQIDAQAAQQDSAQSAQEHQQNMQAKQQDLNTKAQIAEIEKQRLADKAQHETQMQALELQGQKHSAALDALTDTIKMHFQTRQSNLKLSEQAKQAQQDALATHVTNVQDIAHKHVSNKQELHHNAKKNQQTLTLEAQRARQQAKTKKASSPKK